MKSPACGSSGSLSSSAPVPHVEYWRQERQCPTFPQQIKLQPSLHGFERDVKYEREGGETTAMVSPSLVPFLHSLPPYGESGPAGYSLAMACCPGQLHSPHTTKASLDLSQVKLGVLSWLFVSP